MGFSILSTTTDDVKGGKKRRIELSPLPKDVNAGFRLDDFLSAKGGSGKSKVRDGHSDDGAFVIRGRIVSVEDHGCLVDIGIGKNAFLKFDNVEDDYEILEDIMDIDDDEKKSNGLKQSKAKGAGGNSQKLINPGRIYDFTLLPKQNGPILQLSLPSTNTLSRIRLNESITPTLSSLQPGMLTEVKVEQHAKNGMCVNFMGGLYRGSIDEDHLGGHNGDSKDGMWWKGVFRGKHGKVCCFEKCIFCPCALRRLEFLTSYIFCDDCTPSLPQES